MLTCCHPIKCKQFMCLIFLHKIESVGDILRGVDCFIVKVSGYFVCAFCFYSVESKYSETFEGFAGAFDKSQSGEI